MTAEQTNGGDHATATDGSANSEGVAPKADSGPPTGDDKRWTAQFGVTLGLLVALVVYGMFLTIVANDKEEVWQHRVYVFGTLEAITFTAIGWLFGREVHRGEAQTAKKSAEDAKADAATARGEADKAKGDVLEAKQRTSTMEASVRAAKVAAQALAEEPAPPAGGSQPTGLDSPTARQSTTPSARHLHALLNELFPNV